MSENWISVTVSVRGLAHLTLAAHGKKNTTHDWLVDVEQGEMTAMINASDGKTKLYVSVEVKKKDEEKKGNTAQGNALP